MKRTTTTAGILLLLLLLGCSTTTTTKEAGNTTGNSRKERFFEEPVRSQFLMACAGSMPITICLCVEEQLGKGYKDSEEFYNSPDSMDSVISAQRICLRDLGPGVLKELEKAEEELLPRG